MITIPKEHLCIIDVETTGLDADVHEIWEVAYLAWKPGGWINNSFDGPTQWVEPDWKGQTWQLPVDLGRAEPAALRIGRFHERRLRRLAKLDEFAASFAHSTRGKHLVGANVCFDEERLRKLLKANGACPEWDYHKIDVEAMMLDRIISTPGLWERAHGDKPFTLPFKSADLALAIGISPVDFEAGKHTARGDAEWVAAIWDKLTTPEPEDARIDVGEWASTSPHTSRRVGGQIRTYPSRAPGITKLGM